MICHQTCSASSSQHTGYHSWLTVPQQQGVFWNEKVELQSMWIWIHNGRCWWSAKGTLTWLLWNLLTAKYFLTYFFWEASSHRSQQLLGLSSPGEREGRKRAVFEGATLVGILFLASLLCVCRSFAFGQTDSSSYIHDTQRAEERGGDCNATWFLGFKMVSSSLAECCCPKDAQKSIKVV